MVDASLFFHAREPSWKWPNLTSLALTSRLFAPDANPAEIDNMLLAAAAAAMKMPKLDTMEIWNGQVGLAMLFRYQPDRKGGPAVITWKGTWDFALRSSVIQSWEAVALEHRSQGLVIAKELLDAAVVRNHGDAIQHLKLLTAVIRPVSLWQIQMEHMVREGLVGAIQLC